MQSELSVASSMNVTTAPGAERAERAGLSAHSLECDACAKKCEGYANKVRKQRVSEGHAGEKADPVCKSAKVLGTASP